MRCFSRNRHGIVHAANRFGRCAHSTSFPNRLSVCLKNSVLQTNMHLAVEGELTYVAKRRRRRSGCENVVCVWIVVATYSKSYQMKLSIHFTDWTLPNNELSDCSFCPIYYSLRATSFIASQNFKYLNHRAYTKLTSVASRRDRLARKVDLKWKDTAKDAEAGTEKMI